MLSGNDVVVSIYNQYDATSLLSVTLHIDGVAIPAGQETRSFTVRDMLIGLVAVNQPRFRSCPAAMSVDSGSTIFIYENCINFTGFLDETAQVQYNPNNNVQNTIDVQNPDNFELLVSCRQIYRFVGCCQFLRCKTRNDHVIMIYYPELSIDIVLAKDGVSSVQQYGFLDTEGYKVKINSPHVGPRGLGAKVNVVFKCADGSETKYVSVDLFCRHCGEQCPGYDDIVVPAKGSW